MLASYSCTLDLSTSLIVVFRLLLAAISGGMLGFERTRKMRAAGLRTYMLVCIGSAMAAMTGQYIFEATGTGDPQRIAAQVISGIGFIGAGTIMTTGYHRVKGLTTAAGLWVSACLGLAVGVGFYIGVIAMLIITLSAMVIGEKIQISYLSQGRRLRLYILFEDACYFKPFLLYLQENQIAISDFEQLSEIGKSLSITFLLKVNNPHMPHKLVMDMITSYTGVAFVEEI